MASTPDTVHQTHDFSPIFASLRLSNTILHTPHPPKKNQGLITSWLTPILLTQILSFQLTSHLSRIGCTIHKWQSWLFSRIAKQQLSNNSEAKRILNWIQNTRLPSSLAATNTATTTGYLHVSPTDKHARTAVFSNKRSPFSYPACKENHLSSRQTEVQRFGNININHWLWTVT